MVERLGNAINNARADRMQERKKIKHNEVSSGLKRRPCERVNVGDVRASLTKTVSGGGGGKERVSESAWFVGSKSRLI